MFTINISVPFAWVFSSFSFGLSAANFQILVSLLTFVLINCFLSGNANSNGQASRRRGVHVRILTGLQQEYQEAAAEEDPTAELVGFDDVIQRWVRSSLFDQAIWEVCLLRMELEFPASSAYDYVQIGWIDFQGNDTVQTTLRAWNYSFVVYYFVLFPTRFRNGNFQTVLTIT